MIARAVGCLHYQRHLMGFCLRLQCVCQDLPGVSPEPKGGKEPRLAAAPLMGEGQQILGDFCLVYLGITRVGEFQSLLLSSRSAMLHSIAPGVVACNEARQRRDPAPGAPAFAGATSGGRSDE